MKKNHSSLVFAVIVFLSGIAGLAYELIWIRSIKGYFGCEIFSITMVISLFFTGLGLGGFIGARCLKRQHSPFKIYIIIESFIAVFSLLFPFLIKLTQKSYLFFSAGTSADYWILLKAIHVIFLLIIPTTLIGMTLPVIAAIAISRAEEFTSRFSLFYGLNTLGAVLGSLLCGLLLIPYLGLAWTGRIIVLCNLAVAALCWWFQNHHAAPRNDVLFKTQKWNQALFPCVVAFFMGFLALSYEIVYIRMFSFYFLTTTISLALLLSTYLVGLAVGSILLSFWKRPVSVIQLGFIEFAKALFMILSFLLIRKIFYQDWHSIQSAMATDHTFWLLLKYYIVFGLLAFFIPGLWMGMTFPLIERVWPSAKAGTAHVVGIVSAWNTWGGATGSALAGLIFISLIGTTNTLILSIIISIFISTVLFFHTRKYLLSLVPLAAAILVVIYLPREMNWKRKPENLANFQYYKEGKVGSVAVLKNNFGDKTLEIDNTYILGGTSLKALRTQQRQGALPVILNPVPDKKVLKIGEGTGITSLYCADNSGIAQLDIVEIVPEVIDALPYFSYYNQDILSNKAVRIYEGDGREFLELSATRYDIIIGELYTPQIAGTGNLYCIEHFENIKNHLSQNGLFCQWLQLSQFSPEMFQIVVRTFLQVFKQGTFWLVNTNLQIPLVGLVYAPDIAWDSGNLDSGLRQYADSNRKSMGWMAAEDIAGSFVTDNLWDLTGGEQRINSINHPWIEEIAARSFFNQKSMINTFLNKAHWPSEWNHWEKGRQSWQCFWELVDSELKLFEQNKRDQTTLNHLITMLDSLPDIASLKIYKAEIINTITEEILLKQAAKDQNAQLRFVADFYRQAIAADPENYKYRFNMLSIYQMLGEKEKMQNEFHQLWTLLPDHIRNEELYKNMRAQLH